MATLTLPRGPMPRGPHYPSVGVWHAEARNDRTRRYRDRATHLGARCVEPAWKMQSNEPIVTTYTFPWVWVG